MQDNLPLHWRHNGRDGVSNHQPYDCLLNRLFGHRSKKTSKLRVTGLCEGNSPGTGEFPAQMASNAENIPIWWRHHAKEIPRAFVTRGWKYSDCSNGYSHRFLTKCIYGPVYVHEQIIWFRMALIEQMAYQVYLCLRLYLREINYHTFCIAFIGHCLIMRKRMVHGYTHKLASRFDQYDYEFLRAQCVWCLRYWNATAIDVGAYSTN